MKRWWIAGLILAVSATFFAGDASAAPKNQRKVKYPPRWQRTSNAWNYVYRDRNGNKRVREVYPGYSQQFPVPALFYYGYPHSGDDTGLGF